MIAPTSVSTIVARRACLAAELLGDERERRARGLADAEREVPGLAAHRDDEVPARGRLRVDHQVLDDLDADVARRLEAEGADVVRQIEIVVDRLRHVDDAERALRRLGELVGAERRVVAADRDEHADVEPHRATRAPARRCFGLFVGFAREMPRYEPPRKWMRLASAIVSGMTCDVSPSMIQRKPSWMPSTSTPERQARMVAAPMTLLMPGAGPPPTRMASFILGLGAEEGTGRFCHEQARAGRFAKKG